MTPEQYKFWSIVAIAIGVTIALISPIPLTPYIVLGGVIWWIFRSLSNKNT